jgi:hypothetical protein
MAVLPPFKTFAEEGVFLGRLSAGYSTLEINLMNCVYMASGGTLDPIFRAMFSKHGLLARLNAAEKLGYPAYHKLGLGTHFKKVLRAMRYCLKIRNRYAHWIWWDDNTGKLAIADFEKLTKRKRPIKDLSKLKPFHLDIPYLKQQEACFVYVDKYLAWINFEGRLRTKTLPRRLMTLPKAPKRPRLPQ